MKTFKLENKNKTSIEILEYGAIIKSIIFANKNVVLSLDNYKDNPFYIGAIIGPCANRIKDGEFVLNNKKYTLSINNSTNHLHGGEKSLSIATWQAKENCDNIILKYTYKDGEYPATIDFEITYTLTEKDEIIINYKAISDKDTIVNLTNHSYFNLDESINSSQFKIYADLYTPMKNNLPTGEIKSVDNSDYDFRDFKIINDMKFDDNFIINKPKNPNINQNTQTPTIAAQAKSKSISLKVYTTQPALQFYTGDYINNAKALNCDIYNARAGFCFETQGYPNAINHENFPSIVLKKGEEYNHTTIFKFTKI